MHASSRHTSGAATASSFLSRGTPAQVKCFNGSECTAVVSCMPLETPLRTHACTCTRSLPKEHWCTSALALSHGTARNGTTGHGTLRYGGMVWHDPAGHGPARPGPARAVPGLARHGTVRHDIAPYDSRVSKEQRAYLCVSKWQTRSASITDEASNAVLSRRELLQAERIFCGTHNWRMCDLSCTENGRCCIYDHDCSRTDSGGEQVHAREQASREIGRGAR